MSKRLHVVVLLGLLAVAALVLAACGPQEPELGTEENPVVISFVPSADASEVLASAEAIVEVLSEKTGLVITAEVPTSFVGSIEAMCAGEAHIGTLNTFSYVVAKERECADVALASVRFGSPTYTGQIITRADSGITSIEDLAGHSFCRPDEFSTSGWIIPSITMKAAGVDPATDLTEVIDAGGHTGVVRAVYDGDCDAGATFVDARSNIAEESPDVNEVVVVIATSEEIPNDTISFIPSVPAETRDAIVQAFLDMAATESELAILEELYSWAGLIEVDDTFYDPFRQVLDAAGVDINDYVE
jgi:phosphonate transport system substrate-binding protein